MFSQIKLILVGAICLASSLSICGAAEPEPTVAEVTAAMKKAATFFREKAALRGGYVYYYSPDLKDRWGEGKATATQIWVQPPGTPAVGEAYLQAFAATKDLDFLDASLDASDALIAGQLQSGGWANKIDFDPASKECGLFRNGKGNPKGRNLSTLDDGATQSAILFLVHLNRESTFASNAKAKSFEAQLNARGSRIDAAREAAMFAVEGLRKAQFSNGGFPQVWSGPAPDIVSTPAGYPPYDWRTEHREKEYWNLYTLNDGLSGTVVDLLYDAQRVDQECERAMKRLGAFLILAQMPDPQPAWAQQYNFQMYPAWARKFEPPAIAGSESEDVIEALMKIAIYTQEEKYLKPIPAALAYLKKSELPDGQLARFYELKTNKPLYFNSKYELTYSDDDLPTHYGFKKKSSVARLEKQYRELLADGLYEAGRKRLQQKPTRPKAADVAKILADLDGQGRWISTYAGEGLTGQPKFAKGMKYISSAVFSENLRKLSEWLAAEVAKK